MSIVDFSTEMAHFMLCHEFFSITLHLCDTVRGNILQVNFPLRLLALIEEQIVEVGRFPIVLWACSVIVTASFH